MGLLKRNAAFRWLWSGPFLSQLGNALFLIMGLWEIQLKSPVLLSLAGLAAALPSVLSVVGGVVVATPRGPPRRTASNATERRHRGHSS